MAANKYSGADALRKFWDKVSGHIVAINNRLDDVPDQGDVDELKADLAQLDDHKVGYSEVVNGQLKMYSDSTKVKLLATMDLPISTPTDVQINGTSITQDGVANIPHAKIGTFGLINIGYSNNGLQLDSSGYLKTARASTAEVDAKTDVMKPITPDVLDRAVRAGLISNAEIKDADKLLICQTIGAEPKKGEWVLKGSIVCSEDDRGNIESGADVDLSGCTELYVYGSIYASAVVVLTTNVTWIYADLSKANTKRNFCSEWHDSVAGITNVMAKQIDGDYNIMYGNPSSVYSWINGKHISDINSLKINIPNSVISCDIKIYAR